MTHTGARINCKACSPSSFVSGRRDGYEGSARKKHPPTNILSLLHPVNMALEMSESAKKTKSCLVFCVLCRDVRSCASATVYSPEVRRTQARVAMMWLYAPIHRVEPWLRSAQEGQTLSEKSFSKCTWRFPGALLRSPSKPARPNHSVRLRRVGVPTSYKCVSMYTCVLIPPVTLTELDAFAHVPRTSRRIQLSAGDRKPSGNITTSILEDDRAVIVQCQMPSSFLLCTKTSPPTLLRSSIGENTFRNSARTRFGRCSWNTDFHHRSKSDRKTAQHNREK